MKLGEDAPWLAIKCAAGGSNQRLNWGIKRDKIKREPPALLKSFGEVLIKKKKKFT